MSAARRTKPESQAAPATDRLRADIDRGLTGEKVDYPDPAAAPLGTDDEAAGHSASAEERRMEAAARRMARHDGKNSSYVWAYLCGLAAVLLLAAALLIA